MLRAEVGVYLQIFLSEIRKPARLFLAKSNVKMDGSKEKNQVLDEATHTKECVNCLPLVL